MKPPRPASKTLAMEKWHAGNAFRRMSTCGAAAGPAGKLTIVAGIFESDSGLFWN
jgi:hypothetical protein